MDLFERDAHLAHLEEHRRFAAAGQGRVVLVGGEAGVGKTALVDAFARRAAAAAGVLCMSCDALSTLLAVGVHSMAMLAVAGALAIAVYQSVGADILRCAWVNLDLIWVGALAVTGGIALGLGTFAPGLG